MLKIFQLESAAPGVLRAAEVREGEVPRGARADRELHHRQGDTGTAGGSQGETNKHGTMRRRFPDGYRK